MSNPVLYVFVRTDLPSMTPGKAQAHSGHAANAFVYKHYIMKHTPINPVPDWVECCGQGFGTQVNLKASWEQITDTVYKAHQQGFAADIITDPTYPYEVDKEIYNLLPIGLHTATPVFKDNGRVVCFREEQTAAYIFGLKEDLEPIVGHFPLHP